MKKYKNQVEDNESFRIERNDAARGLGARSEFAVGVAICEVEPESVAADLGLLPGDRLLEIDGERARDVLQLKKADGNEIVSLTVASAGGEVTRYSIEKDVAESLGIGVDAELFDGVKRCTNKCPFCFVDQLPPRVKGGPNLRRTLYVRDDDFRLSFLHGHYITLTNLVEADYRRIIEEKLSPLCVSVHATDPATRIRLVGNPGGGQIMERLRFLIANGISINAQVVLCPGINDGAILDQSIADLMELHPGVESVAVVPIGLTRFMPSDRNLSTVSREQAALVLRQLEPWQNLAHSRWGLSFAYASDEMYLLAGQEVPRASFYDGYPQFANGVGTIRAFLDEVGQLSRRKPLLRPNPPAITLVTGALAAPALRQLAAALQKLGVAKAEVVAVPNTYWGGNVGCAGLLMGKEILEALRGRDCGEAVFLPPDAVDNHSRLLDDVTLTQMSAQLGCPVRCDATGPIQLAGLLRRR